MNNDVSMSPPTVLLTQVFFSLQALEVMATLHLMNLARH